MPAVSRFRFIKKHCLICGNLLVLRNNRDIRRKRFCGRACLLENNRPQVAPMTGHRHTDETRRKIGEAMTGPKHPRYKILRDLVKRPLSSFESRRWRIAVYERDNYICQSCGQQGGRLQAHHLQSFKHFPGLRHELSNGQTLCVECHKNTINYAGRGLIHVTGS